MKQASESRQYEKAKEIHDTIQRLSSLQIKQKMESPKFGADEEFFGIKIKDQIAYVMSFRLSNGVIKDRNKFSFDLVGDNSFSSFLSQYYSTNPIPKFIVVNQLPDNKEILGEIFSKTSGFKVNILVPTSGKRREIIDLIMRNILLTISKGTDPALIELQDQIGLDNIPRKIECFGISNHGEDYAVGSMSCLVDAKPYKSGYRKFKIKTVTGRDDFAMINEIVKRRYLRLKQEKTKMPDLVLIDGGRGQLNAALDALYSIDVKIPCISLAKENEEVYLPRYSPLIMKKDNPALKVLQHARDEAHRFGVAHNRAIRKFT
jgi:excinuclease ABC subunit C